MNQPLVDLSRMTGLSPEEIRGLWSDVRANQARLDACEGPHSFDRPEDPARVLGGRWRCSRCGGMVDGVAKGWYERGLEHGRAGRLALPVREG